MITKYTYRNFYDSKATELLSLECEFCHKEFKVIKRRIQSALRNNGKDKCNFCSKSCASKSKTQYQELTCDFCNNKYLKKITQIKKSKSEKHFCSKSCASKSQFYKFTKIIL